MSWVCYGCGTISDEPDMKREELEMDDDPENTELEMYEACPDCDSQDGQHITLE